MQWIHSQARINEVAAMDIPTNNQIDYLIKRNFAGQLKDPGFGLNNEHLMALNAKIAAYRRQFEATPPTEIMELCNQERSKQVQEVDEANRQLDRLQFFNEPNAEADFEFWSKLPLWHLDEAISLAFGKAPEVVKSETMKFYVKVSPFGRKYSRLWDLAVRAKELKQLSDPVKPQEFLAWAKAIEIEVPTELVEQVEKRAASIAGWEKQKRTKAGNSCEELLLKSKYYRRRMQMELNAIREYPAWKRGQRTVKKSGNLKDWLTETIGTDSREVEALKKILSDIFEELNSTKLNLCNVIRLHNGYCTASTSLLSDRLWHTADLVTSLKPRAVQC